MPSQTQPRPHSPTAGPPVKRRLRHVLNFGIHGLTATPHKDEVLQAASGAGGEAHGWLDGGQARDEGAAAADGGSTLSGGGRPETRQRSLDDLDLVVKGRKRGSSVGSARSLHAPPSSPSARTSPSLPTSSSFGTLPSTSPSSSSALLPRRPSLSRTRTSSRLHASRSFQGSAHAHGLPDDHLATSPSLSPTLSRFRSRSVTRASAAAVIDHSQPAPARASDAGLAHHLEADAIPEGQEDLPLPTPAPATPADGFFVYGDDERERALREAGARLLESFVVLRLTDARAAQELVRSAEPGPVSAGLSAAAVNGDAVLEGHGAVERAQGRRRSREEERKGKYRAEPAMTVVAGHSAESSSSTTVSSGDSSSAEHSLDRRSRRSSVSTSPSSPPTPRPKSSASPLSPPSGDTSLSPPTAPLGPDTNPHAAPFFISPAHRPATHPRFAELAPDGSDFAPWARAAGVSREEGLVVELWVRGRATGAEWGQLKAWKVRLDELERWDGKTLLAPNTLTVRLVVDGGAQTYVVRPPVPPTTAAGAAGAGSRARLERVLSDPELHSAGSATAAAAASRKPVVEWGGADEAVRRSLRETRMKVGVGADELLALLRAQTDLQDARLSLATFRADVDGLMRDFDEVDRLRRHTHQVEAQTREVKEQQAAMRARADDTRERTARLREDVARRREQLERGQDVLREEKARQRDFEAAIALEDSLRADIVPYLHGAQGTLVRRLEAIFPLVPVSNGRSQPVFTIAGVALPLPSQPKEPAPPLSVPAAQLPKGITVDEDNVACALGHAALLVDRLAGYVGARLPYPLTCAGSRSLVKDPISDIAGPTRLFPLYAKGIEQYRFEYAVYLLNKDVELLMVGRGLRIMDIRHTLPNLMNLLLTISSDLPMPASSRDLPRPAHLRSTASDAVEQPAGSPSTKPSLSRFEDETESESETLAGGGGGASDDDDDDAGGRTPRALEPASRGLFWGLGGGGGTTTPTTAGSKAAASEKAKPTHRSRRGTLIARAFVGQGSAGKERASSAAAHGEQPAAQAGAGASPKGPVATL